MKLVVLESESMEPGGDGGSAEWIVYHFWRRDWTSSRRLRVDALVRLRFVERRVERASGKQVKTWRIW